MTTISIKDAAILSHLSKQPRESDRLLLTRRLGDDAKILARSLKRDVPQSSGPSRKAKRA
jgi:hypothetical protein